MFERPLHALIAGVVLAGRCAGARRHRRRRSGSGRSCRASTIDGCGGWSPCARLADPRRQRRQHDRLGQGDAAVAAARFGGLLWHRRWLQFGAFVGAVITSELCIGPLKALVDRPRPPDPLIGTSAASFPSGHAIAGAVTAFGLVVVLWPASPRRWLAIGFAAAFAGIMAISRTYLAAHWLTDTIAGACIGTGLALVWPAALEMARERHARRESANSAFADEPCCRTR